MQRDFNARARPEARAGRTTAGAGGAANLRLLAGDERPPGARSLRVFQRFRLRRRAVRILREKDGLSSYPGAAVEAAPASGGSAGIGKARLDEGGEGGPGSDGGRRGDVGRLRASALGTGAGEEDSEPGGAGGRPGELLADGRAVGGLAEGVGGMPETIGKRIWSRARAWS